MTGALVGLATRLPMGRVVHRSPEAGERGPGPPRVPRPHANLHGRDLRSPSHPAGPTPKGSQRRRPSPTALPRLPNYHVHRVDPWYRASASAFFAPMPARSVSPIRTCSPEDRPPHGPLPRLRTDPLRTGTRCRTLEWLRRPRGAKGCRARPTRGLSGSALTMSEPDRTIRVDRLSIDLGGRGPRAPGPGPHGGLARRLPGRSGSWARGDGRGLPRPAAQPEPRRGAEGPPARPEEPHLSQPIRGRGLVGGQAQPPEHRPHLQPRRLRGPPVHRDGVRPGDEPPRISPPQGPARPPPGALDHAAGRRGRRRRGRGGAGPPRHQARKPATDQEGAGQGRRLRPLPRTWTTTATTSPSPA